MSHIFISYSTRDSAFANSLAQELRNQGFDVWIDSDRLRSSVDWWASIVSAIWDCDAFVVILSPHSDSSEWVQREIAIADRKNKHWFPLLLSGDLDTINWQIFLRTQYEDVRGGQLPSAQFYGQLANFTTRKPVPGVDVTAKVDDSASHLSDPVAQEFINNPPPPRSPITSSDESASDSTAAVSPQTDAGTQNIVGSEPAISVPSLNNVENHNAPARTTSFQWRRWLLIIGGVVVLVIVGVPLYFNLAQIPSIFYSSPATEEPATLAPTATLDTLLQVTEEEPATATLVATATPDILLHVTEIAQTQSVAATATEQIVASPSQSTEDLSSNIFINVSYESQRGAGADYAKNDDGPAALLMVLEWYAQNNSSWAIANRISSLNVDAISHAANMSPDTPSVLIVTLMQIAKDYGVPVGICPGYLQNLERVLAELDAGRPALILINYDTLLPGQNHSGNHFVLIVGRDRDNIELYDSLYPPDTAGGASHSIPREQLEQAFSEANNQALLFSADDACPKT